MNHENITKTDSLRQSIPSLESRGYQNIAMEELEILMARTNLLSSN
jgi:hypothetical protein